MPTLYVIRHARPATTGVLVGQSNPGLSTEGRRDASWLNIPKCDVYSSPLRRALETALILHPKPIIVEELAEVSYGDWDGLSWTEIERRWPQLAKEKLSDWSHVPAPGGESWDRFASRVERALTSILRQSSTAAIVAHEAVNAIIDRYFTHSTVNKYKQDYCEIKKYKF